MTKRSTSKSEHAKVRFRSPDTLTRAQWDASRQQLGDKIDEVMASFRDEKLSVKPRDVAPKKSSSARHERHTKLPSAITHGLLRPRYKSPKRSWVPGAVVLAVLSVGIWLVFSGDGKHPANAPVDKAGLADGAREPLPPQR